MQWLQADRAKMRRKLHPATQLHFTPTTTSIKRAISTPPPDAESHPFPSSLCRVYLCFGPVRRSALQNSRPTGRRSPLPHCPFRLRASVGGLGALRPYLVGYPILDNCEIWRPHAPVRAERLNGGVLSWMLGLACRLSNLGGGRSPPLGRLYYI